MKFLQLDDSQRLSFYGSLVLTVFCFVLGLIPTLAFGPTVEGAETSPLTVVILFVFIWFSIYSVDRIITNKKTA